MQASCPNQGCNEAYTIGPEHVGRRSVCKRCGATFIIEADGLRLIDAPILAEVATPPAPDTSKSPSRTRRSLPTPAKGAVGSFLADPFSCLMLAGSLVVVFFLFQPVLDGLKINQISAKMERLSEGSTSIRPPRRGEEPPAESSELKELKEELKEARLDAREATYLYTWFVLVGFLLLVLAEIGYVVTGASRTKRVLGAVLLSGQLLMIFVAYMGASIGASLMR